MIRPGEPVFVDTGAWVALAEVRDPFYERAAAHWEVLERAKARLFSSVPVLVETFTFLDRRGSRELAQRWRTSLRAIRWFTILGCSAQDLQSAWGYLERKGFHKLSLVDATSFALMRKHQIHSAFAFDTHFHQAGFRCEA